MTVYRKGQGKNLKNSVLIKSFQNGITLYLDDEPEFEQILEAVGTRFEEDRNFFKEAHVAVLFEGRELSFEEEKQLIHTITEHCDLNIICVVGRDEETGQVFSKVLEEAGKRAQMEESDGQFYRGTLRSGQILETESSIIVLGDIHPGASVISAGNIVILGSLQGSAYAGGSGQNECTISALEMTPQKLKIGDFKYITNEKRRFFRPFNLRPCTAGIEEGQITFRPITNELLNDLDNADV